MLQLHSAMYSLIHGITQLMVPHKQMQPSSTANKLFLSPQVNELFLSAISEEQPTEKSAPTYKKEEEGAITPPTCPIDTRSDLPERPDTSFTSALVSSPSDSPSVSLVSPPLPFTDYELDMKADTESALQSEKKSPPLSPPALLSEGVSPRAFPPIPARIEQRIKEEEWIQRMTTLSDQQAADIKILPSCPLP